MYHSTIALSSPDSSLQLQPWPRTRQGSSEATDAPQSRQVVPRRNLRRSRRGRAADVDLWRARRAVPARAAGVKCAYRGPQRSSGSLLPRRPNVISGRESTTTPRPDPVAPRSFRPRPRCASLPLRPAPVTTVTSPSCWSRYTPRRWPSSLSGRAPSRPGPAGPDAPALANPLPGPETGPGRSRGATRRRASFRRGGGRGWSDPWVNKGFECFASVEGSPVLRTFLRGVCENSGSACVTLTFNCN